MKGCRDVSGPLWEFIEVTVYASWSESPPDSHRPVLGRRRSCCGLMARVVNATWKEKEAFG